MQITMRAARAGKKIKPVSKDVFYVEMSLKIQKKKA